MYKILILALVLLLNKNVHPASIGYGGYGGSHSAPVAASAPSYAETRVESAPAYSAPAALPVAASAPSYAETKVESVEQAPASYGGYSAPAVTPALEVVAPSTVAYSAPVAATPSYYETPTTHALELVLDTTTTTTVAPIVAYQAPVTVAYTQAYTTTNIAYVAEEEGTYNYGQPLNAKPEVLTTTAYAQNKYDYGYSAPQQSHFVTEEVYSSTSGYVAEDYGELLTTHRPPVLLTESTTVAYAAPAYAPAAPALEMVETTTVAYSAPVQQSYSAPAAVPALEVIETTTVAYSAPVVEAATAAYSAPVAAPALEVIETTTVAAPVVEATTAAYSAPIQQAAPVSSYASPALELPHVIESKPILSEPVVSSSYSSNQIVESKPIVQAPIKQEAPAVSSYHSAY